MGQIRNIALVFIMLLSAAVCRGQNAMKASQLQFDRMEWDFGTIKEEKGVVSYAFTCVNGGSIPIVIERVLTTCGCTVPEFPKSPVKPGDKAFVKVTYDPADRPGFFSKDIYVISGNGTNRDVLTIKGDVAPRPRSVEEDYPFSSGNALRFNTPSLNFRYVGHDSPRSMVISYVNVSKKDVDLSFQITPDNKDITLSAPDKICPRCRGDITVTYHVPRESDFYGRQINRIYPVIDGKRQTISFSVTAIVTDDFERTDYARAPKADIKPGFIHFGNVERKQKLSGEFELTNEGKDVLIVRAVEARNGALSTLKPGTKIAPGKSVKFNCGIDVSVAEKGLKTSVVSILTNDPARAMRDIRLVAYVL